MPRKSSDTSKEERLLPEEATWRDLRRSRDPKLARLSSHSPASHRSASPMPDMSVSTEGAHSKFWRQRSASPRYGKQRSLTPARNQVASPSAKDQEVSIDLKDLHLRTSTKHDIKDIMKVFLKALKPDYNHSLEEDLQSDLGAIKIGQSTPTKADTPSDSGKSAIVISGIFQKKLIGFLRAEWEEDYQEPTDIKGKGKAQPSESWSLYIEYIAVHPDYQGQGLGKLLLERCIDQAKQEATNLRQQVDIYLIAEDYERTHKLFESFGFKSTPIVNEDGFEVVEYRQTVGPKK